MAMDLTIDLKSGTSVSTVPTAAEVSVQTAYLPTRQAALLATATASAQRKSDIATILNTTIAMLSQGNRDAWARLFGCQPLTIPLAQLATSADITLLV